MGGNTLTDDQEAFLVPPNSPGMSNVNDSIMSSITGSKALPDKSTVSRLRNHYIIIWVHCKTVFSPFIFQKGFLSPRILGDFLGFFCLSIFFLFIGTLTSKSKTNPYQSLKENDVQVQYFAEIVRETSAWIDFNFNIVTMPL